MTFTATVFPTTGSGETGTVTFFDDGARIGTATVVNGQATLVVTSLSLGDHDITAAYDGDADFIGSSTTGPVSQLVVGAAADLSRPSAPPELVSLRGAGPETAPSEK